MVASYTYTTKKRRVLRNEFPGAEFKNCHCHSLSNETCNDAMKNLIAMSDMNSKCTAAKQIMQTRPLQQWDYTHNNNN